MSVKARIFIPCNPPLRIKSPALAFVEPNVYGVLVHIVLYLTQCNEFIHAMKVWGTKGLADCNLIGYVPAWSSITECVTSGGLRELKGAGKFSKGHNSGTSRLLSLGGGLRMTFSHHCEMNCGVLKCCWERLKRCNLWERQCAKQQNQVFSRCSFRSPQSLY